MPLDTVLQRKQTESIEGPDTDLIAFQEHLDQHPGAHFLSQPAKLYEGEDNEYDGWSSDSDGDSDEIEWEAGVTDFALFDDDRRRATAAGQALPQKWNGLLQNQASAFGRSVERSLKETSTSDTQQSEKDDTLPALTPDVSPHLADDLEVRSHAEQSSQRPVAPSYLRSRDDDLRVLVTKPRSRSATLEDDNLAVEFFPPPESQQPRARVAPQRPGLSRGSRTLSGKLHVWRRPSLDSRIVQEDMHGERTAEIG